MPYTVQCFEHAITALYISHPRGNRPQAMKLGYFRQVPGLTLHQHHPVSRSLFCIFSVRQSRFSKNMRNVMDTLTHEISDPSYNYSVERTGLLSDNVVNKDRILDP
jgi:hypothetical protein